MKSSVLILEVDSGNGEAIFFGIIFCIITPHFFTICHLLFK